MATIKGISGMTPQEISFELNVVGERGRRRSYGRGKQLHEVKASAFLAKALWVISSASASTYCGEMLPNNPSLSSLGPAVK